MKRLIIPVVVLLTALILTGGFFLPSIVSRLKDEKTVGMLTITDGSGISFETKAELQIVDRLKMMTNAGRIALDNGKNLNAETAFQTALTELGKFNSRSLVEIDLTSCRMLKSAVDFYIDSADPSKNMIVWSLSIEDETHNMWVTVDDETGVLLSFQYSTQQLVLKKEAAVIPRAMPASPFNLELIGESIADYYGLTLVRSEPLKKDRYDYLVFELSDGQNSVSLTVVILDSGFMVNI